MNYQTMLALLGYGMVIVFMILIMTKKMTAFTSLIVVPIVFALIGGLGPKIGAFAASGVKSVAPTASMLLFAILFFGIMINAGLFDPLVDWVLKFVKGDPLKVLVGTAILAAVVSLDGDGSTTAIICCSALVPIYNRLKINKLYLASIVIMQNGIMNLVPWGGPTARVMSVLKLEGSQILQPFLLGMAISILYVIGVAYFIGLKERKRLGITVINKASKDEMAAAIAVDPEELALKRPKLVWVNFLLVVLSVYLLVSGKVSAGIVFEVAAALALMINYPSLKDQRKLIEINAANAIQVVVMVLAAGIFMGVLTDSKMAEAIANNLISLIPQSLGAHFPIITAIISVPGAFFLSNDAFYFGVLPVLAKTGALYGFSAAQIGVAALIGQAFHLLSPLVAAIYLLLQMSGVDMGEWQRYTAKWAIGIFLIYVITIVGSGFMPL
jgi:citrate-Mg2+:H+ or citrate-Ca2+:H+ symporter, CitMHS family